MCHSPPDGEMLTLDGGGGGAAALNAVFVDLSGPTLKPVARASWDLAFYNGDKFRVMINHINEASAMMTHKTNMNRVKLSDIQIPNLSIVKGNGSVKLIDDSSGDLDKTVIKEISASESASEDDNKVYIVCSGGDPVVDNVTKIHVLRHSDKGYTVQYAKINDDHYKTLVVEKNTTHHFTYVSFDKGIVVNIEPAKKDWDFVWTRSTYHTKHGDSVIPYIFSDFVMINHLGGVQVAEVLTSTMAYNDFKEANLSTLNFSSDRTAIGAKWRITKPSSHKETIGVRADRFYVIKDAAGNIYKLKFLSFHEKDGGVRGKPKLMYALVKQGN